MNIEPRPVTIVVSNYKGGVAKTTFAISYALSHNLTLVTNDLTEIYENIGVPNYIKLPERKKTIPTELSNSNNIVYDFGAMNGNADPKLVGAIKNSEAIIVPTTVDEISLLATERFINDAKKYDLTIIVLITLTTTALKNKKSYAKAVDRMNKLVPRTHIKLFRESTMYKRLFEDGIEWFSKLNNENGKGSLKRAIKYQTELFNEIDELIIEGNRVY